MIILIGNLIKHAVKVKQYNIQFNWLAIINLNGQNLLVNSSKLIRIMKKIQVVSGNLKLSQISTKIQSRKMIILVANLTKSNRATVMTTIMITNNMNQKHTLQCHYLIHMSGKPRKKKAVKINVNKALENNDKDRVSEMRHIKLRIIRKLFDLFNFYHKTVDLLRNRRRK